MQINSYEGKRIKEKIIWPFYRYSALMPKQISSDLFIWLYLSLVVLINKGTDIYNDDIKQQVQKIIIDKFSSIIDNQTLSKVINNTEQDFIIIEEEKNGKKTKILNDKTFKFINSYENLFSETVDIKYIYQDAITGEILPFFDDTSYIKDSDDKQDNIKINSSIKQPSKKSIQKAYKQYIKIKKYNINPEDVELEEEYYDEDEQTFLEDKINDIAFDKQNNVNNNSADNKEKQTIENYNIIFLENKRTIYNLDVYISIRDNNFLLESPFGKNTNQWLTKCLLKARNVSEEMDLKIKELESKHIIPEQKIEEYIEHNKRDFASTLIHCQSLYRLVDGLNDNFLRREIIFLDRAFTYKDDTFYFYCGRILDTFIKKIKYQNKSTKIQREQTNFKMFRLEFNKKFANKNIKRYGALVNDNVYDNWRKKYLNKNGKEFVYFKSDLADILLRTNLINSIEMYNDFIVDILDIYSLRTSADHADEKKVDVTQEKLDKLLKVIKVLSILI